MIFVQMSDRATKPLPFISDLNIIYTLLEHVSDNEYDVDNMTDSVADFFCLSSHEAMGYLDTAAYLSLVHQDLHGRYVVTQGAIEFFNAHIDEKRAVFTRLVLNSWIFVALIDRAQQSSSFTEADIASIIASVRTPKGDQRYTASTIGRRAQTIKTWLKWLTNEIGCFRRDEDSYKLS